MLRSSIIHGREFYVVQFIELPFEGIDDYVCVPDTWLLERRESDHKAVVAYPKNENPFDTRDRVKRKERYNEEWSLYMAVVKYASDFYGDAHFWIATRNDFGPLVAEESRITDAQPMLTLRGDNQSHLSKFNHNPRKPLLRISIKRSAPSGTKNQLYKKRLKLSEAGESSSSVVNETNVELNCSKKEQSTVTKDKQPMKCAQREETATASNGNDSTEPRTQTPRIEQNGQALSRPVINVDKPTEVINIDEEYQPQGVKQSDDYNRISQSHLSMSAAKPSTSVKQTSQSCQHTNKEYVLDGDSTSSNLRLRIENVQSIANVHNDHEIRVDEVSNNALSTSHGMLSPLKMSAHLYRNMNGGRRLVPIQKTVEKRLCPMNIAKRNPSDLLLHQPSKLQQQRQSQPYHQDPHQQRQRPKIRARISIKPKNKRQMPTPQGLTKKTIGPILSKVLNSLRQALSTGHVVRSVRVGVRGETSRGD